ncbi:MAG TPA: DNA repair protein RecO [Rhodanobacteraceae bacterium]|nr:DNA repair protein RecO [Rhodanobacteraceae bacterium]
MRTDNHPAFILHARPYRETSLLIEAFTRDHGRIGLVARGVRGSKSRFARAHLQPLQPLLLGWIARGELGTLTAVEPTGTRWMLSGDALFAGIYVNELVQRLSSRNDAHPAAFAAYTECLARLAERSDIAWTLRRFERDLLADLGYALMLSHAAGGEPVDPGASYAYVADTGPVAGIQSSRFPRVSGSALLALDRDEVPGAAELGELRRLMRAVIRDLAGGELNAWTLSPQRFLTLAGIGRATHAAGADAGSDDAEKD